MDLPYLRTHPEHLLTFLTHQRIRTTPVHGGSICVAERLTLEDGADVFLKTWPGGASASPTAVHVTAPPDFFAAEAHGLGWLREAAAVPVPEVLAVTDELLVLEWVEPGEPTPAAAERLGRDLAALHRAGAPSFGAPWPGYIGSLPLDNTAGAAWPEWYAEHRLRPFLRRSVDNGALAPDTAAAVERVADRLPALAGPAEPPARIHGDLWPGNILWSAAGPAWLVDPAAHGGHRETDLALLELFGGAPYAARTLAAYQEAYPLADGWRERTGLHQLYLMLVHTALFGAAYAGAVRALADQFG